MNINELNKKLMNHSPVIMGSESYYKFAVLIPLVRKEDGLHILFEERAHTLRRQPGDICFPGGKIEKGENAKDTAIRETVEELGLQKENIGELYPLDYIVSAYETMVFPFVGLIQNLQGMEINKSEVESVFTVPLSFFASQLPEKYYINYIVKPDPDFPTHLVVGGEDYNWQRRKTVEYFYRYENRVIWGLTAKMLTYFVEEFIKDEDK